MIISQQVEISRSVLMIATSLPSLSLSVNIQERFVCCHNSSVELSPDLHCVLCFCSTEGLASSRLQMFPV